MTFLWIYLILVFISFISMPFLLVYWLEEQDQITVTDLMYCAFLSFFLLIPLIILGQGALKRGLGRKVLWRRKK